ncbi:DUF5331 domain-containing protein [Myxacorys almedinensis]|uniref:DUF5331 domain-containing protein n=1 Tax=Myxacorys almedinensis A TaxID=2690445 RepID=A0A8J8CN54_9CYAN|nr:DUF5331 domain-containing protein [Myxacorys almedinensis]NDJ19250.1 hypothetical protein [Myxacorys almedinensis A]
MNIDQLRQSLKDKWLTYYQENRRWLIRIAIWVNCDGQRRPSSSFILGTLSVLEPRLTELLPLVVDLSNNPDRIVIALGLNFNPDEMLERASGVRAELDDRRVFLPPAKPSISEQLPRRRPAHQDESCEGTGRSSRTQ